MEIMQVTPDEYEAISDRYAQYVDAEDWCASFIPALLQRKNVIALKAVHENHSVGYWISGENIHLCRPDGEAYQKLARLTAGLRVHTLHMLYADPAFRALSVGSRLCAAGADAMRGKGVDRLLVEMVLDENNSCSALVCSRFWRVAARIGPFERYYHDLKQVKPCVLCGKIPCECGAEIFLYNARARIA